MFGLTTNTSCLTFGVLINFVVGKKHPTLLYLLVGNLISMDTFLDLMAAVDGKVGGIDLAPVRENVSSEVFPSASFSSNIRTRLLIFVCLQTGN